MHCSGEKLINLIRWSENYTQMRKKGGNANSDQKSKRNIGLQYWKYWDGIKDSLKSEQEERRTNNTNLVPKRHDKFWNIYCPTTENI